MKALKLLHLYKIKNTKIKQKLNNLLIFLLPYESTWLKIFNKTNETVHASTTKKAIACAH